MTTDRSGSLDAQIDELVPALPAKRSTATERELDPDGVLRMGALVEAAIRQASRASGRA